jgi:pyridoxine 4-dehydrogenase
MPTIIPIPGSSKPERVKENAVIVTLTEAEMKELDGIVAQFPISGGRYPEAHSSLLNG